VLVKAPTIFIIMQDRTRCISSTWITTTIHTGPLRVGATATTILVSNRKYDDEMTPVVYRGLMRRGIYSAVSQAVLHMDFKLLLRHRETNIFLRGTQYGRLAAVAVTKYKKVTYPHCKFMYEVLILYECLSLISSLYSTMIML
jgi:hypothetical protein